MIHRVTLYTYKHRYKRQNENVHVDDNGSGTPQPKTVSARDSSAIRDCSAHFIGTALPIFFFFIIIFFGGGGGGMGRGNLLLYSIYVHQNKIQETLFNVILIFIQGNREII